MLDVEVEVRTARGLACLHFANWAQTCLSPDMIITNMAKTSAFEPPLTIT